MTPHPSPPTGSLRRGLAPLFVVLLLAPAVPLSAQSSDGYLFDSPAGSIGIRGGFAFAAAGGDVFELLTTEHTLDRGDFHSPAMSADLTVTLSDRLDFAASVGYTSVKRDSELEDWEGEDGLPIAQTTEYSRTPVTAGLKYYFRDRGRQIGRLAWVPERYLPYLGVGAGWTRYSLQQSGEFVDFQSCEVIDGEQYCDIIAGFLGSEGWTPTAYVAGGLDVAIMPKVVLNADARYAFASATPGPDYYGYEAIDLAGLQTTVGVSLRF
ncbi:MAG: hypothetical protein WEA24_09950 [Gemmatimonadota bacterium]